jgi:hypothetical protein
LELDGSSSSSPIKLGTESCPLEGATLKLRNRVVVAVSSSVVGNRVIAWRRKWRWHARKTGRVGKPARRRWRGGGWRCDAVRGEEGGGKKGIFGREVRWSTARGSSVGRRRRARVRRVYPLGFGGCARAAAPVANVCRLRQRFASRRRLPECAVRGFVFRTRYKRGSRENAWRVKPRSVWRCEGFRFVSELLQRCGIHALRM